MVARRAQKLTSIANGGCEEDIFVGPQNNIKLGFHCVNATRMKFPVWIAIAGTVQKSQCQTLTSREGLDVSIFALSIECRSFQGKNLLTWFCFTNLQTLHVNAQWFISCQVQLSIWSWWSFRPGSKRTVSITTQSSKFYFTLLLCFSPACLLHTLFFNTAESILGSLFIAVWEVSVLPKLRLASPSVLYAGLEAFGKACQ